MLREASFLGVRCTRSRSCVSLTDCLYGFQIVISSPQPK